MTPLTQTCRVSGKPFVVADEDQAFYAKMGVPLPTLCPEERMRRRLAFRNERHLYHRKCALSGRQMISSASPDKPYPVYDIDVWWSDVWDPLSYGRDFDFSRPFFEQFLELRNAVPRLALQQQKPMENSQYCNCASRNKDCYLVFSTNHCEGCYYGSWINYCKDCVDNENALQNERCYETVDCQNCYNVVYGEESKNCSDSFFIKNCIGVKNCVFCFNLTQAEYCVFNKKMGKEEYEKFLAELNLGSSEAFQKAVVQFEAMKKDMPVKFAYGTANENVSGDYNSNCRNCKTIFESLQCEDVRYSNNLEVNVKNVMDQSYWGSNASEIYECQACGYDIYNLRFCNLCWSNCNDLTYCDHCFSTKDSFGCIGLKQRRFCILNKQYTEEEYHELVPKIVEHMKSTGEWGEFFPISASAFAYNESLAQEWFPLTKEQALARGYAWLDEDEANTYQGPSPVLADHIREATDEVTKLILKCEASGQLYKIIPQELDFYKKMGLPLPRKSPDERHLDRMRRRRPRTLWDRICAECATSFQTTYSPDRPEKVLCEACYLKTVY